MMAAADAVWCGVRTGRRSASGQPDHRVAGPMTGPAWPVDRHGHGRAVLGAGLAGPRRLALIALPEAARHPDSVILGCTHFPLLRETISAVFDASVSIVDSANTTAAAAGDLLDGLGLARGNGDGGGLRGCAAHPSDRRGFWVGSSASAWTWVHELTHIVGDNSHVSDTDNLMINNTGTITNAPPDLTSSQCDRINDDTDMEAC